MIPVQRILLRLNPPSQFIKSSKCYLGQAPTGKPVDTIEAEWEEAKKLFYKPSITYGDFSKRVDSLRVFVFWGLVLGLSIDLVARPLESSYWSNWSVAKLPSRIVDIFGMKKPERIVLAKLGEDNMTDAYREYTRKCNS